MPENAQQQWVPLKGRDLLTAVRDILIRNPERHNQGLWVGNAYSSPEVDVKVPVDQIRTYMYQPLAAEPADTKSLAPPCGTTGCVFGWGAIMSAPQGSFVSNGRIFLPDGHSDSIADWVTLKMGINSNQASFMFSPARSRESLINILNVLIDKLGTDVRVLEALANPKA